MKTALELLKLKFIVNSEGKEDNFGKISFKIGLSAFDEIIKEAKELEKKQLKQCYHFAQIEQQKEFSSIYVGMSFEKWYNEIYKNE